MPSRASQPPSKRSHFDSVTIMVLAPASVVSILISPGVASPVVPPMVQPSAASTAAFVGIVAAVVVAMVVGTQAAGPRLREAPSYTARWARGTALGLLAWLGFTAALPASGVLEAPGTPPRVMFFFVISNLAAVIFAFSRAGTRLVEGLPVAALVGFHAFRLPLELVLHQWYAEGVVPVQMTYAGRNLDIVTGILGVVIGLQLWRRGPSRALVGLFNLVGFALLVNVATIAVLSSPVPFRVFTNDPTLLLAYHAPYAWIVPMCVAPALAGHLLLFRWLWRNR